MTSAIDTSSKVIVVSGKPPEGKVVIVKKSKTEVVIDGIRGKNVDFIIVDDLMSVTDRLTPAQITKLYFDLRTTAQDIEREKKLLEGDQSRDVVRDTDDKTLARLLRARRT